MRFATWNIMKAGANHTLRRINLLRELDWDIIALQEVSPAAWGVLVGAQFAESCCYPFETFDILPTGQQPHGVALLARNGLRLACPELIPNLPKPERGIAAQIVGLPRAVTVASWHAPNAAGEGVAVKMRGYRGITEWLNGKNGALLLGFDGNHWNVSVALEPEHVPINDNVWRPETQFYAGNRSHPLHDAYLAYLRTNPQHYTEVLQQRPGGPLAVSYMRGPKHRRIADRFDYIFASDDIHTITCSYVYEPARAAGSDHGVVVADLDL